ncbi:DUF1345 domain-containing protein [Streptacidiphilus sp. PB12-B1b]|uniref:DUF1345 domain-containing protein n=1 Tax=Streptacidiphilus sp. PB12-B1b TaxID=2705012 RepID=UPI0015F7C877|nr:DUF1345 domain-containing protein [Streptacidiphilus sp. PB12-B1b]QMU77575.1 DUF1345 domain-containing protein [Streptacidiphilus sp. PB12-B1b]
MSDEHSPQPSPSASAPQQPPPPVPRSGPGAPLPPSDRWAEQLHGRLERIESLLVNDPLRQRQEGPWAPAWRRRTQGEARWAVTLVLCVGIVVQWMLPERFTVHPHWLLPVLELALMGALAVANPHRRMERSSTLLRALGLLLAAAVSLANGWSAVLLVRDLVNGSPAVGAVTLLTTGGGVWLTNIIAFSLWYWEWDRGGPAARAMGTHQFPDLLFPQMQQEGIAPADWEPEYPDYLYVAFTNATAFSPTDTMPLSRWAKVLMTIQSVVSLLTLALIVARAVNVLH